MQNTAQKMLEQLTELEQNAIVQKSSEEVNAENVVGFASRSEIIAKQSEEACKLSGNPDFDVFTEYYGLNSFA